MNEPQRSSHGSTASVIPSWKQLVWTGCILAFAAQLMLLKLTPGSPQMAAVQLTASALFILAMVLFGIGARGVLPHKPRLEFGSRPIRPQSPPWYSGKVRILVALLPSLLAVTLFLIGGETPLVVALWAMGVLALFLTQLLPFRPGLRARLVKEWPYILGLLLVLAVAALMRLYRLEAIPYNFDGDYASFGLEARALLNGTQPQIFRFGWGPAPMLGALPAALGLRLFGDSLFGVRAAGLIPGLVTILGVYLLGRDFFHPRVGLIAAAVAAFSYVHLAASRQIHYMDPVAFVLFAAYLLILGLREDSGWAIVASGICTAMCAAYFPSRVVYPILAAVLLFLLLFHRRFILQRRSLLALWIVAALVTLGPMMVVFFRQAPELLARSSGVFILNPVVVQHSMAGFKVTTVTGMLLEQARRSALMFHYYSNTDTQIALRSPFLDPITAPLFTLGLGFALFNLKRLGSFLLTSWVVLGVFIGCFLTVNPPYWVRLILLVPPVAVLATIALEVAYLAILTDPRPRPRSAPTLAATALALLLLWTGYANWQTYTHESGTDATGPTRLARFMLAQPPGARAYVLSTTGWTHTMREFDYLIPNRVVADVSPEQVLAGLENVGTPTFLVLTAEQVDLALSLPSLFPGGTLQSVAYNTPDSVAFYAFTLP